MVKPSPSNVVTQQDAQHAERRKAAGWSAAAQRPELLRKIRARERRRAREQEPLNDAQRQRQTANVRKILRRRKGRIGKMLIPSGNVDIQRIKAISVGLMMLGFIVPVIGFQFTIWLVQLGGTFLEGVPFFNFVLPGQEMIIVGYLLIVAMHFLLFAGTAILFLLRGVDCFSGKKNLIFIACLAASMLIYINIFPFVLIWIYFVIQMQEKTPTENDTVGT